MSKLSLGLLSLSKRLTHSVSVTQKPCLEHLYIIWCSFQENEPTGGSLLMLAISIPKNKQEDFKAVIKNINWKDVLFENDLKITSQNLQSTINTFSIKTKCIKKETDSPG